MGRPARDLTGQKFGKLTIIKRVESDKIRAHWLCKCECGNEAIAETSILTRKKEPKISCGCMSTQKIDMTGQRFGRLLVVKSVKIKGERRHKWKCVCDCGNETFVLRTSLVRGLTTSCGCYAIEKFTELVKNNIKDKHHNWNSNITDEDRIDDRKYPEYSEWRKAVFERDEYTCRKCNDNSGGNLNAHHIENYSSNPDKRTLVDNGITLCEKCHKNYHHIYSSYNNTKEQIDYFLNMELY